MTAVEEKREKIISAIRSLPDDRLDSLQQYIQKIELADKDSVEYIFAEAVAQYGNTLKKLAE
jgi:cyanate lyase